MEQICDYIKCTGCFACQNVCPKNCITLLPNKYGELHPSLDQSNCVNCGLCKATCPVNNDISGSVASDCYAACINGKADRILSSSGGIAALMYRYFVEHLNGIVYGVAWNELLEPHFIRLDSISELIRYRGSKYVQAFVDYSFRDIKSDLLNDKYVLFIGTPCQVAGLKNFLRKDYDKLITCDLLCHGVPPYEYLKQELAYICKWHDLQQVKNCRFRGNDQYNYSLTLWDENVKLLYKKKAMSSPYLLGFLVSLTLRESCYKCKYSNAHRISDITIGDFIGLKNSNSFDGNVSVVVPTTDKGLNFWYKLCQAYPTLYYEKRPYEEALLGGPSFKAPAIRNPKRNKFLKDYEKYGWRYAIMKVLWKSILRNKIMSRLKK